MFYYLGKGTGTFLGLPGLGKAPEQEGASHSRKSKGRFPDSSSKQHGYQRSVLVFTDQYLPCEDKSPFFPLQAVEVRVLQEKGDSSAS